jgi:hypothetical protein
LILDGWCVLRFTQSMIDERPAEVIAMVCEALEMLGAAQRQIVTPRLGLQGQCSLG